MMVNHPIEIELDSADPDNRTWRCVICECTFADFHYRNFCKGTRGHPAIWRDRYGLNNLRRASGAERYGGYLA